MLKEKYGLLVVDPLKVPDGLFIKMDAGIFPVLANANGDAIEVWLESPTYTPAPKMPGAPSEGQRAALEQRQKRVEP